MKDRQDIIRSGFMSFLKIIYIPGVLSQRSITIATYALCGFANPVTALPIMVSNLKS